ncbi:hypothetical protein EPYR_01074 [Erwinia pyrifoliae DSM 12163]|nr:hypothetical protein EPYR_01074 [Erwinia pyrifoliae DSM 12163]
MKSAGTRPGKPAGSHRISSLQDDRTKPSGALFQLL